MNRKTLISSTFSALLAVAAFGAHAEDGTITFTGSIEDSSCIIAADSQDITVEFGQISMSRDGLLPTKHFEINLTDCPANVSNAVVSWSGETTSDGKQMLKAYIDGAEEANAGWIIGTGNQTTILNGTTVSFDGTPEEAKPITEGNNTLDYTAGFSNDTSNVILPGELTGDATYNITYN
ncbi:UNVERIFIED_ORG: major type 1 subunit fimbrin (pilin) [Buttiauxella agrestis ATCC 33320]